MAFSSVRTIRGRNLAAKVQAGTTQMNFTKFTVGDGTLTGQNQENMTSLINQRYTFPVARLKVQSQNVVVIGMSLNNQSINAGFFFREIGLWAQDPDLGEILFAYANAGTGAEYIDAGGSSNVLEKAVNFDITVSNTAQVTAVIDSSLVYATPQDIADALQESKDYTDSEIDKIVIPDASINQKGIVQLTNTNTGTSQTLAPTQKALGDHVNSTVRHTTQAEKDNWNDKISTSTALNWQKSKVTSDDGTAILLGSNYDLNTLNNTGFYRAPSVINGPSGPVNFIYIEHIKHNDNFSIQIVYDFYKSSYYQRVKDSGTWRPWTTDVFTDIATVKQSGVDRKNELVALINANGGSATNAEDMSALIVKLGNISRTRYKEGSTNNGTATPTNNPDWYVLPSGFYNKMVARSAFPDSTRVIIGVFNVGSSGSITIYALDNLGRRINLITYNIAQRILYVTAFQSFVGGAGVATYNSNDNVGRWSNASLQDFDMTNGVRFRFELSGTANAAQGTVSGILPVYGG